MNTARYMVDGELVTAAQIAERNPHLSLATIRNRLWTGASTWAEFAKPMRRTLRKRKPDRRRRDAIPPPCPLNAEFRAWTKGAGKGRALQGLDLHFDPLRAAL